MSGDNKAVGFKISGDSGDAQRAWLEIIGVIKQTQIEIARLGSAMEKQSTRGAKAVDKQATAMDKLRKTYMNMRGAMLVISAMRTAMGLLTSEVENARAAGDRLLAPKVSYQKSIVALNKAVPTEELPATLAELRKYKGPIAQEIINMAAVSSISAGALGMSKPDAGRATVQVAMAFPESEFDQNQIATVTQAAMKVRDMDPRFQTNLPDGRMDFTKSIAFTVAALEKAAQNDPAKFATHVVPAASNLVRKYGYTPAEAFAELAATQTLTGDISGRMGSTTSQLAADQLQTVGKKFGIGLMADGKTTRVPAVREWLAAGSPQALEARKMLLGAHEAAWTDSELAEMTIGQAGGIQVGAAKFKPHMRDLAVGEGPAYDLYRSTILELSDEATAGELQKKLDFLENSPYLPNLRRDFAVKTKAGQMSKQMATPFEVYSEFKKERDKLFDEMNIGYMHGNAIRLEQWATGKGRNKQATYNRMLREIINANMSQYMPGGVYGESVMQGLEFEDIKENVAPEHLERVEALLEYRNSLRPQRVIIDGDERNVPVAEAPNPVGEIGE